MVEFLKIIPEQTVPDTDWPVGPLATNPVDLTSYWPHENQLYPVNRMWL